MGEKLDFLSNVFWTKWFIYSKRTKFEFSEALVPQFSDRAGNIAYYYASAFDKAYLIRFVFDRIYDFLYRKQNIIF